MAISKSNIRPIFRNKFVFMIVVPFALLIHACCGFWFGLEDGLDEVKSAWRVIKEK